MDNISIIIRNKNESRYIGFAIQSCLDHFKKPEIIIVDDNSVDDSEKVISLFDKADIQICKLKKRYTPGYSLNYGVEKCINNTILVLSAHCQITKMDLDYTKKCLKEYKAVFGNQTPLYRGKKITKRYVWSHFRKTKEIDNMFSTIENRQFLHNAFCFYNKDFLLKYPFNEKLHGKEDRYWAIDRVEEGYKYLYTPKLETNHFWTPGGATWKGLG